MKIRYSLFLILILSVTLLSQNTNTITDDLGKEIELPQKVESVISLAPNLTEYVYALNYGDKLVGNTKYCNYPAEALEVEKVGDLMTMDYEKILQINPDLILVTIEGNTKSNYDKLIDLGFKVFVSNPRDFEGIKKTTSDLGKLFGKEEIADSLINSWNRSVTEMEKNNNGKNKSAMFLVSPKPLMLAGKNTFLNEFIVKLGLRNIADASDINYPVFSREEILKQNPDYIFFPSMTEGPTKELSEVYPEWKNIDAFKYSGVITLNPDLYFRPGPRFVEALLKLKNLIHH